MSDVVRDATFREEEIAHPDQLDGSSRVHDVRVEQILPVERRVVISARESGVMPVLSVEQAVQRFRELKAFVREVMDEGLDYGTIPGTSKDTLYKAGAEKLTTLFGLSPSFDIIKSVERWGDGGEEPLFYYMIRCYLHRGDILIASAEGSCNSREKKYRWRYVPEHRVPAHLHPSELEQGGGKISEFAFAVENKETTGQYGKPVEYWQKFEDAIAEGTARNYKRRTRAGKELDAWEIDGTTYRIPNPDIFDIVNTVLKMAEKRALVAAVLMGANASEFFTQDMEDGAEPSTTTSSTGLDIDKAAQDARQAISLLAWRRGIIDGVDDIQGKKAMLAAAASEELTVGNMLDRLGEWLVWIENQTVEREPSE
jgi:hypothetical protein